MATHPPAKPRDARVAAALALIEANLANPRLTVTQLAGEVGLTPSRLRQLVQRDLRTSMKRYIVERRMSQARELLKSSFLSVKEVMVLVGVRDASHFWKTYRRQFGSGPRADRTHFRIL